MISVSGNPNNETTNRVEDVRSSTVNWLVILCAIRALTAKRKLFLRMKSRSDANYSAIEKHLLFVVGWYKCTVGRGILRAFLFQHLPTELRTIKWN
jgi:hypothetical protein